MKILLKILTSLLSVPVFTGAFSSFSSSINSPFMIGITPQENRTAIDVEERAQISATNYFPASVFFMSEAYMMIKIMNPISIITSKAVISPGRSIILIPPSAAKPQIRETTVMITFPILLPPLCDEPWD